MKHLLTLIVLGVLLAGCGYRQANTYQTQDKAQAGVRFPVRTVSIATFNNDTAMQEAPAQLAELLKQRVASETPYHLADAVNADSAILGRITSARPKQGVKTPASAADIESYRIEFSWRDLYEEKDLLSRQSIEVASLGDAASAISSAMYSRGGKSTAEGRDGYTWHSLYREDVRTVAVPIFTNRSYARGLEVQLTKAITNHLESNTPYKVASRDNADTILEGEIVSVSGAMVSADAHSALPQEEMITITVNFVWKDLRSGQILAQRRSFQQSTMYYPTLGEGAYVGKQSGAERLAIAIVQELQAEW